MSDTAARPRPKPRRPAPPKLTSQASSSAEAGTSSTAAQRQREVDEEDALFLRNKSRTTQYWKKLEKANKELGRSTGLESSDEELVWGQSSPRSRKHKKTPINVLPNWTRSKDIVRLLSEDQDDDALQEVEIEEGPGQSPNKRKRVQSRSRSITPPPALSIQSLQNARNLVRQTLDTMHRPVSPTLVGEDDSTDTIVLDPELAQIAQDILSQPSRHSSMNEISGGPEVVTIKVKWQPHPLNEVGQASVWGFKMKRNDTFRQVFEETADLANILSDHLIVSFGGKRVFPSATPNSLKMWADGELEACDQMTHNYIRAHHNQRGRSPSVVLEDECAPDANSDESEAESAGGDNFKLVLRSAVTTTDITLTVRPTTTCGAIVKAFLKAAKLADKYPDVGISSSKKGKKGATEPTLEIDGDRMSPMAPIGDVDLEDGDMVEVVGL